ncbi:MAG TPA: YdeI/OmpD-associated family protein [Puia sp.]|jgi:uncharacterized protein YdeI (YjbR/CyaY-like superfamily)|nr:YdeI/OmpD-associated family protein [Puia sp.]
MQPADKKELKTLSFKTPVEFVKWLSKNHDTSSGIWLRFFKKDSGEKTITYSEALDEALCYGWIDGQLNSCDDKSWLRKFTPRGQRSVWSKRNTSHAERLITAGKMKDSGFAEVEKAKADGRWVKAYDSPAAMKMPDDFLMELSKHHKAKTFFESLNRANKYAIGWRLQTAKKPELRDKRIKAIVEMLNKQQKFH